MSEIRIKQKVISYLSSNYDKNTNSTDSQYTFPSSWGGSVNHCDFNDKGSEQLQNPEKPVSRSNSPYTNSLFCIVS